MRRIVQETLSLSPLEAWSGTAQQEVLARQQLSKHLTFLHILLLLVLLSFVFSESTLKDCCPRWRRRQQQVVGVSSTQLLNADGRVKPSSANNDAGQPEPHFVLVKLPFNWIWGFNQCFWQRRV